MLIGVPRESGEREQRVALTPEAVTELVRAGWQVVVGAGAGLGSGHSDDSYVEAGATIGDAYSAEVIVKVEPPTLEEARGLREGATLISFIYAARNAELVAALASREATVLAMDRVPRTTIAQKCDALSSMAGLAGQRAVLEAANVMQRPLGAVFSAAGKVAPARVLVIGAGVAGLAAVGTAKSLGARVRAFDTRLAAKDDVKSLGAEFLELDFEESGEGKGGYGKVMSKEFIAAEMALFLEQARETDIVITTALVPGAKAPRLWTAEHVEAMPHGAVVVDLAAHQGGNCELTQADARIEVTTQAGRVTILGPTDLASRMAHTASELYSRNIVNLLLEIGNTPEAFAKPLSAHEIAGPMATLLAGKAPPPPPAAPPPAPAAAAPPEPKRAPPPAKVEPVVAEAAPEPPPAERKGGMRAFVFAGVGALLIAGWLLLRYAAGGDDISPMRAEVERFVDQLAVFVLACFVGWQVIWNVTPALHTPLMSVTNAISGIIIVGGLIEGSHGGTFDARTMLGLAAVTLATINIVGGFWVTQRMLKMFRK